jgi:hypothetical protein
MELGQCLLAGWAASLGHRLMLARRARQTAAFTNSL